MFDWIVNTSLELPSRLIGNYIFKLLMLIARVLEGTEIEMSFKLASQQEVPVVYQILNKFGSTIANLK